MNVREARGSVSIVLVVFAMLLVQSTFSRLLAPYPLAPYLGLPFVFALGTASAVGMVRGAATAFAVGYLYDLFSGNPLGLHALAFVIGFSAARLVGYVVPFRGLPFEAFLTFFGTLALGGLIETIRALSPAGMAWDRATLTAALLGSAFATTLLGPPLFALSRRIDPQIEGAPA